MLVVGYTANGYVKSEDESGEARRPAARPSVTLRGVHLSAHLSLVSRSYLDRISLVPRSYLARQVWKKSLQPSPILSAVGGVSSTGSEYEVHA